MPYIRSLDREAGSGALDESMLFLNQRAFASDDPGQRGIVVRFERPHAVLMRAVEFDLQGANAFQDAACGLGVREPGRSLSASGCCSRHRRHMSIVRADLVRTPAPG
jgi:hypothetical protein